MNVFRAKRTKSLVKSKEKRYFSVKEIRERNLTLSLTLTLAKEIRERNTRKVSVKNLGES